MSRTINSLNSNTAEITHSGEMKARLMLSIKAHNNLLNIIKESILQNLFQKKSLIQHMRKLYLRHRIRFEKNDHQNPSYYNQMMILSSRFTKALQPFLPINKNVHQPYHILRRALHFFSQGKENVTLSHIGQLNVRNSQTLELKLQQITQSRKFQSVVYQIDANSNLSSIAHIFQKTYNAKDAQFHSEKGEIISKNTPVEAFINRSFYVINRQQGYNIKINGQLLQTKIDESRQLDSSQLKENLRQLQLPVIAQRQIESYFKRVEIWLDAKYGFSLKAKLKQKQIQDILVQSIVDPQCHWNTLNNLQEEWFRKYVEIRQLRQRRNEALKLSQKMATRYMTLGLGMIAANIGFIWSGTYVFFSWDIIEPIAYFTSSLASIVLFGQFLKLKKPFSLQNYRDYLINHYLPQASEKIGLNLSDLETKEMQLHIVESIIKDYLIAKL